MSEIHFNIEAAEEFCDRLKSRREGLEERLRDEQTLYAAVFDVWTDKRGESMRDRLAEFTKQVQTAAADLDDLAAAVQRQIGAAREFLDASETW